MVKNNPNPNEWIEVEGSRCYNKDYKFCYYKGKPENKYELCNFWYICCVGGRHHVLVFGRGRGCIHYMKGCSDHHYSKTRNVTKTYFKRMFRVVDFDENIHTLSDVEKIYPDGIVENNFLFSK